MRHGEAEFYREPDATRALTPYGISQCERVGKWLTQNKSLVSIDLALVSPYLRTQQSLKAVNRHIPIKKQMVIDDITPMGNPARCADLLHGFANAEDNIEEKSPTSVLVVTHMPLVSLLADRICVEFDARIFETADTLICEYDVNRGLALQNDFFQARA